MYRFEHTSEDFTYHARRTAEASKREIYVYVIGEASRAANWQLYGYHRETNPCLTHTEGLVVFRNTVTQSNTTHKSVPLDSFVGKNRSTRRTIPSQGASGTLQGGWVQNLVSFQPAPPGSHDRQVGQGCRQPGVPSGATLRYATAGSDETGYRRRSGTRPAHHPALLRLSFHLSPTIPP